MTDSLRDEPYHQLAVGIFLERTPFFYAFNIIYPGGVIIAVSVLGFYVRGIGKITFVVSIMASMMMFQQYLIEFGGLYSESRVSILGEPQSFPHLSLLLFFLVKVVGKAQRVAPHYSRLK